MNQPDESLSSQANPPKNFLSILNNTLGAGSLKESTMACMGNNTVVQQSCMQDISPLLVGLLLNISKADSQKGKDADVLDGNLLHQQRDGDEDNKVFEIDLAGMNEDCAEAILQVLNSIYAMLSKDEIGLDIKEAIQKITFDDILTDTGGAQSFSCDDLLVPGKRKIESAGEEKNQNILSEGLPGNEQKKDDVRQVLPLPMKNADIMQVINSYGYGLTNPAVKYDSNPVPMSIPVVSGQFDDKEIHGDLGAHIPLLEKAVSAEYLALRESNGKSDAYPVSSTKAQQQLLNNIADVVKQIRNTNTNKEPSFTGYEQVVLDSGTIDSEKMKAQQQLLNNIADVVKQIKNTNTNKEPSFTGHERVILNSGTIDTEKMKAQQHLLNNFADVKQTKNTDKELSFTGNQQSGLDSRNIDTASMDSKQQLLNNVADAVKQTKNSNKEPSSTVRQQYGLDNGSIDSIKNNVQFFFAKNDATVNKPIITQEIDITDTHIKDIKVLSKENDYLPFSKQDRFENTVFQETQNHKIAKETPFTSIMTEKIEKIVEQYSAKGPSMDMIIRLKINDNETLLVGLKNDGQRVTVDIRTTNEGVINLLQTQKDDIARNLEEKNVFTNIFVDPDSDGSFERREERRENQRNSKETAKQKNFIEFLETAV
jgi:predicted transcriptional regulator